MRLKRIIALLCVLILAATVVGCNKKKNADAVQKIEGVTDSDKEKVSPTIKEEDQGQQVQAITEKEKGYYLETIAELEGIEEGENMMGLSFNSDGNPECYTCIPKETDSIINCYTIKGDKAEKKTVEWANKAIHDAGGIVLQCEKGEDGQYFLLLLDYIKLDKKVNGEQITFVSVRIFQNAGNDTDYKEITPEEWKDRDTITYGSYSGGGERVIKITKDGILVYQDNGDFLFHAYSLKEQKEIDMSVVNKSMPTGGFIAFPYLKDNSMYYFADGEPNLCIYDLSTQKETKIACDLSLSNSRVSATDDGCIYLANMEGIFCCRPGGTIWENIVPGNEKVMGSPSYSLSSLLVKEGEHKQFYVGLKSRLTTGKDMVVSYQFSTDPLPEVTNSLSIYSLRENVTIRDAIIDYQKEHPEVKFDYRVAIPVEGEVNISDVIRTLNTELLAGKGADILILDGLPMSSYIEKGALLDLTDILSPMVTDGILLNNVANNYVKDNKIYAMPLRYIVPYYLTCEDQKVKMCSMKDLTELSESLSGHILPTRTYEGLLRMFLYTYYDDFMKDGKNIDPALFTDFLKQIKSISDNIRIGSWDLKSFMDGGLEYDKAYMRFIFLDDCLGQMSEKTFASTGYAASMTDFNLPFSSAKKQKGILTTINDVFMASGIIGVNSTSKNQELAKDFIQYLFSEKVQSAQLMDGFPINANSLEAYCNIDPTEGEHSWVSMGNKDGRTAEVEIKGTTVDEKHELKKLLLDVSMPAFDNEIVYNMIMEESLGYLTGEKTLEQAVDDTSTKINMYLAEQ